MSPEIDGPLVNTHDEEHQRRIERAEAAMLRNQIVVSGHRLAPKVIWALRPRTEAELRRVVEADGMAPFEVLAILPLDRRALKLPGAPVWAQVAYLVMVTVKATFGNAE